MADWLEIQVRADGIDIDELAGIAASEIAAASAGVEVRPGAVAFWVEEGSGDEAVAAARRLLGELGVSGEVTSAPAAPESEWREAYKRYFRSARLTRQLVAVPSWEQLPELGPGDLVIHIDPGMAFGTGSHATTRLVLGALQDIADRGAPAPRRVLDFGTGSGILAMGLALLCPGAQITAIDNDPLAVEAARENIERNRLEERIQVSATPPSELSGPFDLVAANIQRPVLLEHAAELARLAPAPGAVLVLSGLLLDHLDEVEAAYVERGFAPRARPLSGDWGALVMERPAR